MNIKLAERVSNIWNLMEETGVDGTIDHATDNQIQEEIYDKVQIQIVISSLGQFRYFETL